MNPPSSRPTHGYRLAGLLLAAVLLGGCQTSSWSWQDLTRPVMASHTPANVYLAGGLPSDLRRVVLLPLTLPANSSEAEDTRAAMEQALQQEILKANRFELIIVTPAQLRLWTGRAQWSAEDKLPRDFFAQVREQAGCDAVLFARVTRFRAYPPLTVGLSLKLVHGEAPNRILWAVDEVFDAGQPEVVNSAIAFARRNATGSEHLSDGWSVLHSPRRFSQYAANAVMATLPAR